MHCSDQAAARLLAEFGRRGITVELAPNDMLKVSPADRLTEDDAKQIRALKPALLQLVACQHRHHEPRWWRSEPRPSRHPDRLMVTCRCCGKFIGFRLTPSRN